MVPADVNLYHRDKDEAVDNGWTRVILNFGVMKNDADVGIYGAVANTSGSAYFDCFQLEEGTTASKYNILRNPRFEDPDGNGIRHWGGGELEDRDGRAPSEYGNHSIDRDYSARLYGQYGVRKSYSQPTHTSGKKGNVFTLSGWAKAYSIPEGWGKFRISAAFLYTDGDTQWNSVEFNRNTVDWQFNSITFQAEKDYRDIHVYIFYGDNVNEAYFDSVQLIKDNCPSYVYDNEGNLVSAADVADKSAFQYDDDDNLTQLTDPTGSSFEYTYDSKKNLKTAKNSDGQIYYFQYNEYGNPISAELRGEKTASITGGKTYYLRNKKSGKYLAAENTSKDTDVNVMQTEFNGAVNTQWRLEDAGKGYFVIRPAYSQTLAVNPFDSNDPHTNINVHSTPMTEEAPWWAKWKIKTRDDGAYAIGSEKSKGELCLSVDGDSTEDGANISLAEDANEDRQGWYFEEVKEASLPQPEDGGVYYIRNQYTKKYLAVEGGDQVIDGENGAGKTDGTNVEQTTLTGGSNMQWKLQKSVDGYFILRPMHEEILALDVTSTTDLNSNVDVYNTEDSSPDVLEWAEWELRANEDGSYILVSRGLGLRCAANVLGSSMEDGANVECRLVNGDPCQTGIWRR